MWIKREYKQLPSCSVRDVSWLICIPSAGTHAGNTSSKSRDVTRTQQEYNNLIEFSVEMIPTGHVALGAVQLFCGHCNLPGDSLHVTSLPISVAWDGLVCLMSWTKDQWALMSQQKAGDFQTCLQMYCSVSVSQSAALIGRPPDRMCMFIYQSNCPHSFVLLSTHTFSHMLSTFSFSYLYIHTSAR